MLACGALRRHAREAVPIIDVHAHYLPRGLPDFAARHDDRRWPTLVIDADGSRIMQHGRVYRTVDESYFSLERRLEQMEELGIQHQVLSPLPVSLASWADPLVAVDYCRAFNEMLADAVRQHPDRFSAFGIVPLQSPELACEQLAEFRSLGLAGVEIGTWLGDAMGIDDPAVSLFFEAAQEVDLPVLLHPNHPQTFSSGGPSGIELAVGVGSDTSRALASLFLADALGAESDLRLCAVHGGGGFFWLWPRFLEVAARLGTRCTIPPGLFVDTAGLDDRNLVYLRSVLGDQRIVFGSDLPAGGVPWTQSTIRALQSLDWDPEVLERNTVAFLGRDPRV